MSDDLRLPIKSDADVVTARQQGRELAARLGFGECELTLIATAISEVARNIVEYAGRGEVVLSLTDVNNSPGIIVVARDEGPGIPNLELALRDGYSTHGSLGLGLPGARRLMDEFEIVSEVGKGTTVTMKKWLPRHTMRFPLSPRR
ncbi:MAG: anti-sigma regulatory factor [Acidobacteriia bacterium]|nr:anti-sigma regulatory factor [Terriglobia bacterium]